MWYDDSYSCSPYSVMRTVMGFVSCRSCTLLPFHESVCGRQYMCEQRLLVSDSSAVWHRAVPLCWASELIPSLKMYLRASFGGFVDERRSASRCMCTPVMWIISLCKESCQGPCVVAVLDLMLWQGNSFTLPVGQAHILNTVQLPQ